MRTSRQIPASTAGVLAGAGICAGATALAKVETEVLRDHLGHCIEGAIISGDRDEQRRKASELIQLLERAAR